MTRMQLIRQRKEADCGIAALAMYLGFSYEDAYVAFAAVDRECRGARGLNLCDVEAAAKRLGIALRRRRRFDVEEDEGVLMVLWNKGRPTYRGHFVVLRHGLVFDPGDGFIVSAPEYLLTQNARPGTLLTEDA